MSVSTVNISFQENLLKEIDSVAKNESRTRSELIREAARLYIERKKKWQSIYNYGENIASKYEFIEKDIMNEIKEYRKEKTI
ncbi:MAG: ribbon-helix-helix domain-containing protein [Clostridiales bacterium]|jgi:metal-responsive CopG/Arc/MetJ family transcriptional regulator|nr:ribbon-helix-helix domain-containing protein [Clostridiales bacterium]